MLKSELLNAYLLDHNCLLINLLSLKKTIEEVAAGVEQLDILLVVLRTASARTKTIGSTNHLTSSSNSFTSNLSIPAFDL